MRHPTLSALTVGALAGALLVAAAAAPAGAQLRDQTRVAPTNDLPNPYARVHAWGELQLSFDGEAGMQQLEAHLYLLLEGEALPRELR